MEDTHQLVDWFLRCGECGSIMRSLRSFEIVLNVLKKMLEIEGWMSKSPHQTSRLLSQKRLVSLSATVLIRG